MKLRLLVPRRTFVFRLWRVVKSTVRTLLLHVSAFVRGGHLILGEKLRVLHKTRFQGAGTLRIGNRVTFGYELGGAIGIPILLQPREPTSEIHIGTGTTVMNGCELIARTAIRLGENCLVGSNTKILDSDFHGILPWERVLPGKTEPVEIGDNVWIGMEAMILKGVRIGEDAVIGARSVVVRNVPPGSIVAGNPAKTIGSVYARGT